MANRNRHACAEAFVLFCVICTSFEAAALLQLPDSVTSVAVGGCADNIDCSLFPRMTACDRSSPSQLHWAYTNCRQTCNMCHEPVPCVDDLSNCAMFGQRLCTDDAYIAYRPKCQSTCKLC